MRIDMRMRPTRLRPKLRRGKHPLDHPCYFPGGGRLTSRQRGPAHTYDRPLKARRTSTSGDGVTALSAARRSAGSAARYWATVGAGMSGKVDSWGLIVDN